VVVRHELLKIERHEHRLLPGYASTHRVSLLADAISYAPACGRFLSGLLGAMIVSQRASVGADSLIVGSQPGSVGTVQLTGQGGLESSLLYGATGADECVIGDGGLATVIVSDGGFLAASDFLDRVVVGRQAGSSGSVTLTGAGTVWSSAQDRFVLGQSGAASLTITNGAQLFTSTNNQAVLAEAEGSTAMITIGAGSSWTEDVQGVVLAGAGVATLNLQPGSSLNFQASRLVVNPTGTVTGSGTINGGVFNLGTIRPGNSPGVLTINGNYRQLPEIAGVPQSGRLEMEVNGTSPGQFDRLVVTGSAELGGGLQVTFAPGVSIPDGQLLRLIDPLQTIGAFDVAYVPLLSEQRFVRVRYGLEDGGVSVDTAPLQLAYDPSSGQSQGLLGTPAAAAIGEFDGVNGPDLAVAIPGPTPTEPGSVLIFLNQGVSGGQWNNFAAGQQIVVLPVGSDPSDLAVANMDGQQRDDLVVATRGDSRVRVLLNNGTGLGFATGATITTSVPPSSVAVAPLLDDPGVDLPDIMVAEGDASRLLLLRSNDQSTPSYSAVLTLPVPRKPRGVRPTGEDRDKRQNVVVMMADDDDEGSVQIIRFQPNQTLSVSAEVPIGRDPRQLAVGDLNDDGVPEIVTANAGDQGTVSIVVNRTPIGPGTPELAPSVSLPIVIGSTAPAVSVAIADIQGDGVRDVAVVAGGATRSVYALRNDTPAGETSVTLAQAQSVNTSPNPLLVVATDVDQSGVSDLIGISGSSGGGRSLDQIVTLPARPLGCADLDFNNDGVFPDNQDIADFIGVFAGGDCPTGAGLCDSIDFNADGVFPDTEDLVDFINVFAGGSCG
jgi:T5SS/PEP-CTERM-associated repeat protein